MISFTIPGEPQGKARARTGFNPKVGRVTSKTPEKTVNYEAFVKAMFYAIYKDTKLSGPLKMDIKAYFTIPQSKSKKVKQQMLDGIIRPTKKPDWDNIAKIISDALNTIAYDDDTQIVDGAIHKWYSDNPRVEVSITKIDMSEVSI